MKRLLRVAALAGFIIVTNVTTLFMLGEMSGSQAGPPDCVAGDIDGDGSCNSTTPWRARNRRSSRRPRHFVEDVLQHVSVESLDDGGGRDEQDNPGG